MDYDKIGNLISSLRKEKGLTQVELANKLRITDRAVSKWERGLGCPDVSLLDDLSRILDISIIEILKGRRLDKDEIIDNKKIIESMNYSKESTNNKTKDIVNKVIITLIILISLLLVFFNLKSMYYINKKYYGSYTYETDMSMFEDNKKYIEIIKNNQGIYSDEDYKKILEYINELDNNLKTINSEYYYSKKYFNYNEMVAFSGLQSRYGYQYALFNDINNIYYVIHKYDPSIISNILEYSMYNTKLIEFNIGLVNELSKAYDYNQGLSSSVANSVYVLISMEYKRDSILLKDIIKVGEINE